MRTVLLYNPQAGSRRRARRVLLDLAASYLKRTGFAAELVPTTSRGSAAQQAAQAIALGAEAIFACGGDGTVHDVLQGIAGTNVALGILPFGSANALGRELGIARDPLIAAQQFRPACSRATPLGVVQRKGEPDRYFLSMAGAGPDGALMYRMLTTDRSRWGYWLYYTNALQLFLRLDFAPFRVRFLDSNGIWQEQSCVSVMALRIATLGGLFAGIAKGASLHHAGMRVLLVRPPARLSLPLWILTSWLRLSSLNPLVTTADANALEINADGTRTHLQADGEWLGHSPATILLLSQTVRMLIPAET